MAEDCPSSDEAEVQTSWLRRPWNAPACSLLPSWAGTAGPDQSWVHKIGAYEFHLGCWLRAPDCPAGVSLPARAWRWCPRPKLKLMTLTPGIENLHILETRTGIDAGGSDGGW